MNLIFAGTPEFAAPALLALHTAGHRVLAVYTQPDRPAGRGRSPTPSPIKAQALGHGWQIHQPGTLRGAASALSRLNSDAMIVVAYGLILPPEILAVPRLGCINVHASLLPRWRGAAPIPRSIEAGDTETGVSIMRMDVGLDTGPVYAQIATPIQDNDTSASLEHRLAALGAETLVTVLARLEHESLSPRPQPESGICYARKLRKDEAEIDWEQSAPAIHRKIRALNPRPVACTRLNGKRLRVWNVGPLEKRVAPAVSVPPGTVLSTAAEEIRVATGSGVLGLSQLQTEGGTVLLARDFVNGQRLAAGDRFG